MFHKLSTAGCCAAAIAPPLSIPRLNTVFSSVGLRVARERSTRRFGCQRAPASKSFRLAPTRRAPGSEMGIFKRYAELDG